MIGKKFFGLTNRSISSVVQPISMFGVLPETSIAHVAHKEQLNMRRKYCNGVGLFLMEYTWNNKEGKNLLHQMRPSARRLKRKDFLF